MILVSLLKQILELPPMIIVAYPAPVKWHMDLCFVASLVMENFENDEAIIVVSEIRQLQT